MAIRRFAAATTREAMLQVRRELGEDAVIIANRRVGNHIEILAAAPDAVDALVERSESRAASMRERTPGKPRATERSEEPVRTKVEPFQEFVRRQMQSAPADAAAAQRIARPAPARAPDMPLQRNAGVAMYHDVADIEDIEAPAPHPAPARAIDQAPRAQAAAMQPSHRAQQVETAAPDPAVFRRRPARVAPAPARVETAAAPAASAPRAAAMPPPLDIELDPQPATPPKFDAASMPAPQVVPAQAALATGTAVVPALPVRSQAAPIAVAARLRATAASLAHDAPPAPTAEPFVEATAPQAAAPVPPAAAPAQPDALPWEASIAPAVQVVPIAPVVAAQPAAFAALPVKPKAAAATSAHPRVETQLLAELQSMRDLLREQLATLAVKPAEAAPANAPATRVMTRLLTAGFSVEVARRIAAHVPASVDLAHVETWLLDVLAHNIRCAAPADGIVERAGAPATPGQVYALVGPTGVGKTTTVAKLAARFAVRHGTSALGLVTLDAYRVAAPEQLRAYGRILGTPVHLAQDSATLRELLATMVHKRLVLIDTCGVSQRDQRLGEVLDLLATCGSANRPIQRVLLLNGASHAETLDEAARAWRAPECAGAILTKLDEAARIGGSLDVTLRHRLALLGLTNGQRVPEDWHAANGKVLAHLALKPGAPLFELGDDEGAALVQADPSTPSIAAAHGATHG